MIPSVCRTSKLSKGESKLKDFLIRFFFAAATLTAWTVIVYGTKDPPVQVTQSSSVPQPPSGLSFNRAQFQQINLPHEAKVPENQILPSLVNMEKNREADFFQIPQALLLTSTNVVANKSRSICVPFLKFRASHIQHSI